jgi:septal ring-binding cell division protein DamX
MPSREPELYKDKIEVSLDSRQIFYLFFGGAAIVGLVFVLGVMVGRRVEARGHLDRAQTQTASDPLAALDRLERSDNLSFHGALTGSEPSTDVEKAIGELEKRRAGGKPDKKPAPLSSPADGGDVKPAKPETKPEAKPEIKPNAKPETKHNKPESNADAHAAPVTRPEGDKPRTEKHDGEKKAKGHEDASGEPRSEKSDAKRDVRTEGKPNAKADAKAGGEGRARFTLQLSSFQSKSEAEAFLTAMKSAGYQPYLTEANVSGKGTFYRVRLGSYRSPEAANDAKADYEKAMKKTAQVTRL